MKILAATLAGALFDANLSSGVSDAWTRWNLYTLVTSETFSREFQYVDEIYGPLDGFAGQPQH